MAGGGHIVGVGGTGYWPAPNDPNLPTKPGGTMEKGANKNIPQVANGRHAKGRDCGYNMDGDSSTLNSKPPWFGVTYMEGR